MAKKSSIGRAQYEEISQELNEETPISLIHNLKIRYAISHYFQSGWTLASTLIQRYRRHINLSGCPFSHSNLTLTLTFDDQMFKHFNFSRSHFPDLTFFFSCEGLNLSGADFSYTNISTNPDEPLFHLCAADHKSGNLAININLAGANLTGTNIASSCSGFYASDFSATKWMNAQLPLRLVNSNLRNADLSGSRIVGANSKLLWVGTDLRGAVIDDATKKTLRQSMRHLKNSGQIWSFPPERQAAFRPLFSYFDRNFLLPWDECMYALLVMRAQTTEEFEALKREIPSGLMIIRPITSWFVWTFKTALDTVSENFLSLQQHPTHSHKPDSPTL